MIFFLIVITVTAELQINDKELVKIMIAMSINSAPVT